MTQPGLDFGLLPHRVVVDLQDIGNWKVRATAIDAVKECVEEASSKSLQDSLPGFCPFLGSLLADPNFKISHAALQLLTSITQRVGKQLRPHVRELLPGLMQALGDLKPQAVKSYGPGTLDYNSIVHQLVAVLDVHEAEACNGALDALTAVQSKGNAAFAAMLASAQASPTAQRRLAARFPDEVHAAACSQQHASTSTNKIGPVRHQRHTAAPPPHLVLPDVMTESSTATADPRIESSPAASRPLRRNAASMAASSSHDDLPSIHGHGILSSNLGARGHLGAGVSADMPHTYRRSPSGSSMDATDMHPTQPLLDVLDSPVNIDGYGCASPPGLLGTASRASSQAGSMLRMSSQSLQGSPPLREKSMFRQSPGGDLSCGNPPAARPPDTIGASLSANILGSQEKLYGDTGEGLPSVKSSRKVQRALFENQQPATAALDWSIPAAGSPSMSPNGLQASSGSVPLHSPFAQPLQELPGAQNIEARLGELRLNSPDSLSLISQGGDGSVSPTKAGTKLAHLKRRQQEARRAMSAGGTPGFLTPVSSWSPAGSRVSSAMSEMVSRDGSGMYPAASGGLPDTLGLEGSSEQPWASASSSPSLSPKRSAGSLPRMQRRMTSRPGPDSPLSSAASSPSIPFASAEDPTLYASPSSYSPSPSGYYASQPTTPVGGSATNGYSSAGAGVRTPSRTFRHHSSGSLSEGPGTPGGSGTVIEMVAVEDLQPCSHPEADLDGVLQGLQRANVAKRKDLDWQAQTQDLNRARCLVKHHPRLVQPQLHALVLAAAPALEALRSTTAKSAMMLFSEIFELFGRAADAEAEHIVPLLAKKAGEVSVAGRENFLATEAEAALATMVENLSETRVATALLGSIGAKSPHVRAKLASHMDAIVQGDHGLRLLSSMTVLEKLFQAAAGFLEEGSQETRTHGKRILCIVRQLTSSISYDEFRRLVARLPGSSFSGDIASFSGASSPLGSYPSTPLKTPPRPAARSGLSRNSLSRTPSQARSLSRGSSISGESSASGHALYSIVPEPESGASGMQRLSPRPSMAAMRGNAKAASSTRSLRKTGSLSSNGSAEGSRQAGVPRSASIGLGSGEVLIEGRAISGANVPSRLSEGAAWEAQPDALGSFMSSQSNHQRDGQDAASLAQLDESIQQLADANAKVNLQALEAIGTMMPRLSSSIVVRLNSLVPAIALKLGAANPRVASKASEVMGGIAQYVDAGLLMQHVLPAALSMMMEKKSDVRASASALIACIAQHMGSDVVGRASVGMALPQNVQDKISELLRINVEQQMVSGRSAWAGMKS
ncbi:hypothetical protein WJX84_010810 [Apatococcus fuscideae]|uniref:CLASP N-terminal domain-containing protein n=1 Tax=Apatococcus fuscideae TaxID=2026836 RepID=A0AAW1SZK0_9CHLO